MEIAHDGEDGLHSARELACDAIVLDLMLPRLSGWDLLAALRAEGRVRIGLRRDGEAAELTVADTGPGIAAADLPRVFEPFFRTDAARTRDAGGTGLGLAIARAIVRRHGGEVTCASAPGRGTTMTIRLPVAYGHDA